jgi:hypothetical protein
LYGHARKILSNSRYKYMPSPKKLVLVPTISLSCISFPLVTNIPFADFSTRDYDNKKSTPESISSIIPQIVPLSQYY